MLKKTELSGLWLIWTISILLHALIFFILDDFLESNESVTKVGNPPVLLRTLLYIVAIIGFLIIKLVRYVMIHLSKTMLGNISAKSRYAKTVITSMILAEMLAIFAAILVIRQDEANNLYIFAVLFFLAMAIYRPSNTEYQDIVKTLKSRIND